MDICVLILPLVSLDPLLPVAFFISVAPVYPPHPYPFVPPEVSPAIK